jgi:small subunit ribosomal protein S9
MSSVAFIGTGRRKDAVARVRIAPGTGQKTINEKSFEDYFRRRNLVTQAQEPMAMTGTLTRYDVVAKVNGGGLSGQAGAVSLGIARALKSAQPELSSALRKEGFLTRDPRMKERKKYGQPGARKRFQFSKR